MNKPNTVLELLSDPQKWTTKAAARDQSGQSSNPSSSTATCWCLLGAVEYIYGCDYHSKRNKLQQAIYDLYGKNINAVSFNDNTERTHKDIVAVLERAQI